MNGQSQENILTFPRWAWLFSSTAPQPALEIPGTTMGSCKVGLAGKTQPGSWVMSWSLEILWAQLETLWHAEVCEQEIQLKKMGRGDSNMETHSVQFSSVAQSYLTLCDPIDCSTPGLPVHHQLLEFTQSHVHWVSDAIQPSHHLLSPSPPAFNLSQHQGLFKWVGSSHQVAKVLEFQLHHQSFQWTFRADFL